jgi:hypothetical protein
LELLYEEELTYIKNLQCSLNYTRCHEHVKGGFPDINKSEGPDAEGREHNISKGAVLDLKIR